MDKDVVFQSQPITTQAQLYYSLALAVSKGKNEENVLENILHLKKHIFCNTCASNKKSTSTWVVSKKGITAVFLQSRVAGSKGLEGRECSSEHSSL